MAQIILINGPSSAGKSTLANALHKAIDEPFLHFSFDVFIECNVIPMEKIRQEQIDWPTMRPQVFNGYHRCLQALASAGNNLIVDHINEQQSWLDDLVYLLADDDVFFAGVHCSVEELERREKARGDRRIGEARRDLEYVHSFSDYDFELNAERPLEDNVAKLIYAWRNKIKPTRFDQLMLARK